MKIFSMLEQKLESKYNDIKNNKLILIKKPINLLYFPFLIYYYIKIRWNKYGNTVYLTETDIRSHALSKNKNGSKNNLVKISKLKKEKNILNKRILENKKYSHKYIKEATKRFKQKDYMYVLFFNNKPAAYSFISENYANIIQVNYKKRLPSQYFAIYDVYTFKEFRGKGCYKKLLKNIFTIMNKKGFKKLWLWIIRQNKISIQVHNSLDINKVICIYRERYRYGFRLLSVIKKEICLSRLL